MMGSSVVPVHAPLIDMIEAHSMETETGAGSLASCVSTNLLFHLEATPFAILSPVTHPEVRRL